MRMVGEDLNSQETAINSDCISLAARIRQNVESIQVGLLPRLHGSLRLGTDQIPTPDRNG